MKKDTKKEFSKKYLSIEFHTCRNYPLSSVNKDNMGRQKTADVGGVKRTIISPQSQKKAQKDAFNQEVGEKYRGTLTRHAALFAEKVLEKELKHLEMTDVQRRCVHAKMTKLGVKNPGFTNDETAAILAGGVIVKKKGKGEEEDTVWNTSEYSDYETKQLISLSKQEIYQIVEALFLQLKDTTPEEFLAAKNNFKKIKFQYDGNNITRAFFGSMPTQEGMRTVSGAIQQGFGFSSHEHPYNFDYFTGIDTVINQSAILDSKPISSQFIYSASCLERPELFDSLCYSEEAIKKAEDLYLEHRWGTDVTGGRHNQFHATLPILLLIRFKASKKNYSLGNAYVDPISTSYVGGKASVTNKSLEALIVEAIDVYKNQHGVDSLDLWYIDAKYKEEMSKLIKEKDPEAMVISSFNALREEYKKLCKE